MDKNKIITAATKLVQKGQYDKAIAEYRRILEKDPKDVRILLKVGELQQKKGENAAAAATMIEVADGYAGEGFFLKAVAVFKQVLKLDPNRVDVNLRLAELYQQLGLMSDAMAQLQAAASQFDKQGKPSDSIEVLRRMVALDPENLASRIRLAEVLTGAGQRADALQELRRAADQLRGGSRVEDYLKVGERIVALEPRNVELGRELAHAYLAKKDPRRALAKLQVCFQEDPKSPETLELLARAFRAVSQDGKAASVYKELAKAQAERGKPAEAREAWRRVLELVPADPEAVAALGAGAAPAPPSPPAAPGPLPGFATNGGPSRGPLPPRPPSSPGPRPPAANGSSLGASAAGGGDAIGRLLTETDVFLKYGLVDKAAEHLRRIFAIDPACIAAHEKALQLHEKRSPADHAASLAALARLHAAQGETEQGRARYEALRRLAPSHPEVSALAGVYDGAAGGADGLGGLSDEPLFLAAGDDEAVALTSEVIELVPDGSGVIDLPLAGRSEIVELEPGPGSEVIELVETGEAEPPASREANGRRPEDDAALELVVEAGALVYEAGAGLDSDRLAGDPFEDAREEPSLLDAAAEAEEPVELDDEPDPGDGGDDELALELALDSADADATTVAVDGPAVDGGDDDELALELAVDSADADATTVAVDEPAVDLALGTEEEDEGATVVASVPVEPGAGADGWGADEEPTRILPGLAIDGPDPEPELAAFGLDDGEGDFPPPESFGGLRASDNPWGLDEAALAELQAEIDEAAFYLEQGMRAEAEGAYRRVLARAPGHPVAMERLAELSAPGAEAAPAARAPRPPAAPQLDDGGFDLGAALAAELFDDEPGLEVEDAGQVSAADVFEQFKRGVAESVSPEDAATHFDLAIAYREMGLYPDAIAELELARAGCPGEPRELECWLTAGLCHAAQGEHERALEAYREALACEALTKDAEAAIRFEMAQAHELLGENDKALVELGRVSRLDGSFREVRKEISRLVSLRRGASGS